MKKLDERIRGSMRPTNTLEDQGKVGPIQDSKCETSNAEGHGVETWTVKKDKRRS